MTTIDAEREPYLEGVYAPVDDEIDAVDLAVTGVIPAALDGTFLRNGPNPMFAPKGRYHLFDGDGMVHGLTLRDGKASYRNRWVRSRGLGAEIDAGRSLYGGMANADFPSPDEVGDAGPMKNVANTHVIRHAGHVLCLWEAGPPDRAQPGARHARALRLRRRARRSDDRPPQGRPRHRRAVLLRLLGGPALPPLPRGRRRPAACCARSTSTCRRR